MTQLSENARIVLGGTFGFGQVLTYHMIDSIPSPEMQTALDELVSAGMLLREEGLPDMTSNAVRYRVAGGVDLSEFKREAWERIADSSAPSIRVFIPRAA